ncbi:low temperature requirement protein A [Levilactobacillus tangyuanensis]|uniref:Low temperature requirement protein A n=1 Tax=Levilactobacillus tangyuanensis TaxID=2486021 RepID=A0ABW1TLD2_9LACO|nr:low temperature requirement protein A [Levilactobacillus tangyuanensis]
MNTNRKSWWGAPRTITNAIENRKISWLELFSDLVYVVIIHSFVENLSEHFNLFGFVTFWVLFLFFFNTWTNMVLYFDLHGENNLRNVCFALLQIVAVAVTATFTPDAFAGHYTGFILAYSFNQLIYMYLYFRTMIADPLHATTTRPFLISYLIGEAIFIGSIWVPNLAVQQGLIVASLLIFVSTVMAESGNFDREFKTRQIPFELNSAVLERYGLFTMIVLGESLAGIIEHMSEEHTHIADYGHFIIALACIIGTWMIYYTLMDERTVTAHRYWPISLFRGIHRFLIACLILQSFFISQTLESGETVYYHGLVIVTALMLCALLALAVPKLYNVDPLPTYQFKWIAASIVIILLLALAPVFIGLFITDLLLLGIGVWTWADNQ